MTGDEVAKWASLLAVLLSMGSLVWGWLTSGGAKALIEIRQLREEMRLLDTRLIRLENELLHLPDREQTHRLELSISELKGHITGLDERLKPVAAISDRLQEFLLNQVAGR
jgi:hypothetical protein